MNSEDKQFKPSRDGSSDHVLNLITKLLGSGIDADDFKDLIDGLNAWLHKLREIEALTVKFSRDVPIPKILILLKPEGFIFRRPGFTVETDWRTYLRLKREGETRQ